MDSSYFRTYVWKNFKLDSQFMRIMRRIFTINLVNFQFNQKSYQFTFILLDLSQFSLKLYLIDYRHNFLFTSYVPAYFESLWILESIAVNKKMAYNMCIASDFSIRQCISVMWELDNENSRILTTLKKLFNHIPQKGLVEK